MSYVNHKSHTDSQTAMKAVAMRRKNEMLKENENANENEDKIEKSKEAVLSESPTGKVC